MDAVVIVEPDIDRLLDYSPRYNRARSRCRLRVWRDRQVAVVTELADNPGMSVTNAAEELARAIETMLGVNLVSGEWRMFEHYQANSVRPATLDQVTFLRRDHAGYPASLQWKHRGSDPDWAWLVGSLAEMAR